MSLSIACDANGLPWAQVREVKAGSVLIADGGFISDGVNVFCLDEGKEYTVDQDVYGMFLLCKEGKHYLTGQFMATHLGKVCRPYYMGLYYKKA